MVVEDEVVLNFGDDDDSTENKENPNSNSNFEDKAKDNPLKRAKTPKNEMWLGRGGLDGASDSIGGEEEERDEVKDLASSKGIGLWGSPRPPGEAERLRDLGPHKRRWTVTEK